jgi:hypothetical protein
MTIEFAVAGSRGLAMEGRLEAIEHKGLANALDGGQADVEGVRDGVVRPGRSLRAAIGLEQDAGVSLGAGGSFAGGNEGVQGGALLRCQANDIFLVHEVSWLSKAWSDGTRIPTNAVLIKLLWSEY